MWRHYGLDYDSTDRSVATGECGQPRHGGRDVSARRLRPHDPLRGGAAGRHRPAGAGPGPAAQVRHHRAGVADRPVRREKARLEREPITNANIDAATSGPDISEEEDEVILREEEPVVEKWVVPRETE